VVVLLAEAAVLEVLAVVATAEFTQQVAVLLEAPIQAAVVVAHIILLTAHKHLVLAALALSSLKYLTT
jgi:hypothetical protein